MVATTTAISKCYTHSS